MLYKIEFVLSFNGRDEHGHRAQETFFFTGEL